jgi:hypothetical protein
MHSATCSSRKRPSENDTNVPSVNLSAKNDKSVFCFCFQMQATRNVRHLLPDQKVPCAYLRQIKCELFPQMGPDDSACDGERPPCADYRSLYLLTAFFALKVEIFSSVRRLCHCSRKAHQAPSLDAGLRVLNPTRDY